MLLPEPSRSRSNTQPRQRFGAAARRVALPAVLALLAGCGSDPATRAGSSARVRIAFASNRPPSHLSNSDIYFYELSTGGPTTMPLDVNTIFKEYVPALSGNGEWLAYNTTNTDLLGPPAQLLLYHVSDARLVIPQRPLAFLNPWNPSLSYDGRYLAFQTQEGAYFQLDIVLMDAFADTLVRTPKLHAFGAADFAPSLSGDGKLIAFSTNRWGSFDVALYDLAGDSLIDLPGINTAYSDIGARISRDGRYLAFDSGRPGGVGDFDVYVYDRATSRFLDLPGANTTLSESNVSISPDGRYLAYQTDDDGGGDIRLYDIVLRTIVPLSGLNDGYFADRNPSLAQH